MISVLSIAMIVPTLASNSDVYPNVTEINTYKTVFPISSMYAYGLQNGQQYNLMQTFNVDLVANFMGSGEGSLSWRENSSTWENEKGWSELQWDNTITTAGDTKFIWVMDYVADGSFNYVSTLGTNNLTYTFEPFAYSAEYNYIQHPTAYMGYDNLGDYDVVNVKVSFKTNIVNVAGARETVYVERTYQGTLNNSTIGVRLVDEGVMDSILQQLSQDSIVISDYNVTVTVPRGNLLTLRLENIVDGKAPTINDVIDEIDISFTEEGNWYSAIIKAVDAFLNAPIFGEGQFTIAGLLIVVLGIAVFLAFLKIFAGG